MKWKEAKHNDERFKGGFLLFPKKVGCETRWLEYAYWRETYLPNRNKGYSWFAQEWITFTNYYLKGKTMEEWANEIYGTSGGGIDE